jgi:hypothetical protein
MVPVTDHVARTVGVGREFVVIALRVGENGPVDQEHVNVLQTQALQALLQCQFQAGVIRCPRLGHDHDILALDARREGLLQTLANLILVAIAVSAIDESIARFESVNDGFLDFARLGFPGAESYGWHELAIVEFEGLVSHVCWCLM